MMIPQCFNYAQVIVPRQPGSNRPVGQHLKIREDDLFNLPGHQASQLSVPDPLGKLLRGEPAKVRRRHLFPGFVQA